MVSTAHDAGTRRRRSPVYAPLAANFVDGPPGARHCCCELDPHTRLCMEHTADNKRFRSETAAIRRTLRSFGGLIHKQAPYCNLSANRCISGFVKVRTFRNL
ncbi:hypothetical protein RB195_019603 [Necator americanus]|uniref:Uncharacterized protein n=1 Tax=Necator americanus TaxID=51031 RepID=A0ABR1CHT7_NECAM